MIYFFIFISIRVQSFLLDHNISLIPLFSVLGLFVYFSKDIAINENFIFDMIWFLPFLFSLYTKSKKLSINYFWENIVCKRLSIKLFQWGKGCKKIACLSCYFNNFFCSMLTVTWKDFQFLDSFKGKIEFDESQSIVCEEKFCFLPSSLSINIRLIFYDYYSRIRFRIESLLDSLNTFIWFLSFTFGF